MNLAPKISRFWGFFSPYFFLEKKGFFLVCFLARKFNAGGLLRAFFDAVFFPNFYRILVCTKILGLAKEKKKIVNYTNCIFGVWRLFLFSFAEIGAERLARIG
jgi:hypothetical protein